MKFVIIGAGLLAFGIAFLAYNSTYVLESTEDNSHVTVRLLEQQQSFDDSSIAAVSDISPPPKGELKSAEVTTDKPQGLASSESHQISDSMMRTYVIPQLEKRAKAANEVKNRFHEEVRDNNWANRKESSITEALYSNELLSSLSPSAVVCKQSICSSKLVLNSLDSNEAAVNPRQVLSELSKSIRGSQDVRGMRFHLAGHQTEKPEEIQLFIYESD